jgi:tRNA threonylcarbamoyladenosine biosynthesis protein TsaB
MGRRASRDSRKRPRNLNRSDTRIYGKDWPPNCPIIGPVLTLSIDTSSPTGSIAVLNGEKLLGVVSTTGPEAYSSRLFRQLDFLLRELSLELPQFELYAVAAGPGSFTGLRVGLTAVKGWAEAYGKPIAAVSALEATATQSRATAPLLVPVLDAGRGQLYFGFYQREEKGLTLEGDECVMSPVEFVSALRQRASGSLFAIVTLTPEVITSRLPQSEIELVPVEAVDAVLAPVIGRIGFARAQRGQLTDALHLDANYVRRSDAELHWKGP